MDRSTDQGIKTADFQLFSKFLMKINIFPAINKEETTNEIKNRKHSQRTQFKDTLTALKYRIVQRSVSFGQ
jgi:hypothetical protein